MLLEQEDVAIGECYIRFQVGPFELPPDVPKIPEYMETSIQRITGGKIENRKGAFM